MKNPLLATFGIAMALTLSTAATAQMHHDNDPHHQAPPRGPVAHKGPMVHKDNYGSWNNSWGARPGAAPSFWTKKGDWYRHVRACQRKYHGYRWQNDTYRLGKKWIRCRL